MAENIYDEIEIEDMTYHAGEELYTYPCPCGDRFEITLSELQSGETDGIAVCPSCSLMVRVIFDAGDLPGVNVMGDKVEAVQAVEAQA